jgi:hypothetical protein
VVERLLCDVEVELQNPTDETFFFHLIKYIEILAKLKPNAGKPHISYNLTKTQT